MVDIQKDTSHLPEADCAVYDFSGRNSSAEDALGYCYTFIENNVPQKDVYWYTFPKGYSEYHGERLIIYQILEKDSYPHDFYQKIRATEANGYSLNATDHIVKKMVITTVDWSDKDLFICYNLGIDDDDYKKLIDDAWKGLKHEWRSGTGRLLSNEERLATLYDLEPKVKFTPARLKGRKPKLPTSSLKPKRSNLVYLTREKGSRSACFDRTFLFPHARGPIF